LRITKVVQGCLWERVSIARPGKARKRTQSVVTVGIDAIDDPSRIRVDSVVAFSILASRDEVEGRGCRSMCCVEERDKETNRLRNLLMRTRAISSMKKMIKRGSFQAGRESSTSCSTRSNSRPWDVQGDKQTREQGRDASDCSVCRNNVPFREFFRADASSVASDASENPRSCRSAGEQAEIAESWASDVVVGEGNLALRLLRFEVIRLLFAHCATCATIASTTSSYPPHRSRSSEDS
jgi:hypothetical protein